MSMNELSKYVEPPRRASWWPISLAIGLIATSWWCVEYAETAKKATAQQLAMLALVQAKHTASRPRSPSRQELEIQKQWHQLILERDFDWENVFQGLQNANHPHIELLEFRPDKQQSVLVLVGEAKTAAALSDYLLKLAEQPTFARVYLARQSPKILGQAGAVTFELRGKLASKTLR